MKDCIKVVFIIPSLRAGGAERVVSYVAENINRGVFCAHLLVVGGQKDQSYNVEGIPVTFLNKTKVRNGIVGIIRFLASEDVDIVMSTMAHLNSALAFISFLFPRIKFVGRETIVRSGKKHYVKLKKKRSLFSKIKPKSLDAIICQSQDMKNDLVHNYGYPEHKLIVINNPITKNFVLKKKQKSPKKVKHIITVGRLTKQKGYFRVLRVLSRLETPFHYTIIGKGDQEKPIKDLIRKLGMGKSVTIVTFTNEVEAYLADSDLYIQGSFVEGFPNALLESCAVGTPVLAFEALGGINEIIREGINGFIAEDEDDFLLKLRKSLEMPWNAELIRRSVTEKYSDSIILARYESFFKELVKS